VIRGPGLRGSADVAMAGLSVMPIALEVDPYKARQGLLFREKEAKSFCLCCRGFIRKGPRQHAQKLFGPFSRKRTACFLRVMVETGWS
jgi:hypothetical protein